MIDDDAIAELLSREIAGLIAAYRFGSTATGHARRDSDVDLAVLPGAALSGAERLRLTELLADLLRRDVDLVDLRRASTVLRMQVVAQGTPLSVGDEAARGRFEDRVFSDYARLNEERRAILEQIAREGTVHGR